MPKIIIDIPDDIARRMSYLFAEGMLSRDNFVPSDCELKMEALFAAFFEPRTQREGLRTFALKATGTGRWQQPMLVLEEKETPGGQAEIDRARAMDLASKFLYRLFLRVGRDSAAGCAVRRALGFAGDLPLEEAARAFGTTPDSLRRIQASLEKDLGDMRASASTD